MLDAEATGKNGCIEKQEFACPLLVIRLNKLLNDDDFRTWASTSSPNLGHIRQL